MLGYGHGDVIRGLDASGTPGFALDVTERDGRWYGRGTADNKGQHAINLAAHCGRARDARQARLQCQVADRDGRGGRLPRPARTVRASNAICSGQTC